MEAELSNTTTMVWRASLRIQRGSQMSHVSMSTARICSQRGRELRIFSMRAPAMLSGFTRSSKKSVVTRTLRGRSWSM